MRTLLLLAFAVLLAACSQPEATAPAGPLADAAAGPASAAAQGVTVIGHGRAAGEPDTLRATVGVEVADEDVQEAFDRAARAAEDVIDALRRHVPAEDVQTRQLALHPEHRTRPDRGAGETPYVARNVVEVVLREVDRAGEVLADAVDAGGEHARLQGVRLDLEDDSSLVQAAREAAFTDARAKAEQYAELAGVELGELVALSETGGQEPRPLPARRAPAAEADAAEVPVQPGEEEVDVRVRATWALR